MTTFTHAKRRFTTRQGRTFTAIVIPPGHPSPHNPHRVADQEAVIEFFDYTYTGTSFTPDGQYVSGYNISTFLTGSTDTGLTLNGGVDVWQIDATTRREIHEWALWAQFGYDAVPADTTNTSTA